MKYVLLVPVISGLMVAGCSKDETATPACAHQPSISSSAAENVKPPTDTKEAAISPALLASAKNVISNHNGSFTTQAVSSVPIAPKASDVSPALTSTASAPALSATQTVSQGVTNEVQQVLVPAIQSAVAQLGQSGGFLNNTNVKLGMPDQLQSVEKIARGLGQGQMADNVIAAVNHTAEAVVPVAGSVLTNAALQLKPEDVKSVATNAVGTNAVTSLTQVFRQKSESQLAEKIQPMVKSALDRTGAGTTCQQLMDKANLNPFSSASASASAPAGIDTFITSKTLDGLFKVVGEKETQIRQSLTGKAVK